MLKDAEGWWKVFHFKAIVAHLKSRDQKLKRTKCIENIRKPWLKSTASLESATHQELQSSWNAHPLPLGPPASTCQAAQFSSGTGQWFVPPTIPWAFVHSTWEIDRVWEGYMKSFELILRYSSKAIKKTTFKGNRSTHLIYKFQNHPQTKPAFSYKFELLPKTFTKRSLQNSTAISQSLTNYHQPMRSWNQASYKIETWLQETTQVCQATAFESYNKITWRQCAVFHSIKGSSAAPSIQKAGSPTLRPSI